MINTPDKYEPLRSSGWFGSPERSAFVRPLLQMPVWKRTLMAILSPRKAKLARAYNRVAADALNRGDDETFDAAVERGDELWAEVLQPNEKAQPRPSA